MATVMNPRQPVRVRCADRGKDAVITVDKHAIEVSVAVQNAYNKAPGQVVEIDGHERLEKADIRTFIAMTQAVSAADFDKWGMSFKDHVRVGRSLELLTRGASNTLKHVRREMDVKGTERVPLFEVAGRRVRRAARAAAAEPAADASAEAPAGAGESPAHTGEGGGGRGGQQQQQQQRRSSRRGRAEASDEAGEEAQPAQPDSARAAKAARRSAAARAAALALEAEESRDDARDGGGEDAARDAAASRPARDYVVVTSKTVLCLAGSDAAKEARGGAAPVEIDEALVPGIQEVLLTGLASLYQGGWVAWAAQAAHFVVKNSEVLGGAAFVAEVRDRVAALGGEALKDVLRPLDGFLGGGARSSDAPPPASDFGEVFEHASPAEVKAPSGAGWRVLDGTKDTLFNVAVEPLEWRCAANHADQ